MGVPTAPKLTGVDWMINPTITAAIAGKPIASNSGATTAAGVPKPEAPSMKLPKSGETLWGVAQQYYGNGNLYHRLLTANPSITNPNLIRVVDVIRVPRAE